jgi:hypothetical protein
VLACHNSTKFTSLAIELFKPDDDDPEPTLANIYQILVQKTDYEKHGVAMYCVYIAAERPQQLFLDKLTKEQNEDCKLIGEFYYELRQHLCKNSPYVMDEFKTLIEAYPKLIRYEGKPYTLGDADNILIHIAYHELSMHEKFKQHVDLEKCRIISISDICYNRDMDIWKYLKECARKSDELNKALFAYELRTNKGKKEVLPSIDKSLAKLMLDTQTELISTKRGEKRKKLQKLTELYPVLENCYKFSDVVYNVFNTLAYHLLSMDERYSHCVNIERCQFSILPANIGPVYHTIERDAFMKAIDNKYISAIGAYAHYRRNEQEVRDYIYELIHQYDHCSCTGSPESSDDDNQSVDSDVQERMEWYVEDDSKLHTALDKLLDYDESFQCKFYDRYEEQ